MTHFDRDSWHQTDEGCDLRSRHLDSLARWLWLPGSRFRLADERFTLANAFRIRGKISPAEANYRHTLRLLEGRPRPLRSKELLRRHSLIAACHNHLGMMWLEHGPAERAAAAFDEAISYRRNLLRHFPKDRENQVYLGGALCNRGHAAADSDPTSAAAFYHESLQILRQPTQTCDCSYWDEERQSWWCSQLESLAQLLGLPWVELAPQFIDNAMRGLASLKPTPAEEH
jgi:tetratricopeptide (TPR) repeat protein